MGNLVSKLLRISKPKIWMWILNAIVSAIVTYVVTIRFGNLSISNEVFLKYPFAFSYFVLIYLICILGFGIMEVSCLMFYRAYRKMKHFQANFPEAETNSPPVIQPTKIRIPLSQFVEIYQKDLMKLCQGNGKNLLSNHLQWSDFPAFIETIVKIAFPNIANDSKFSIAESIQNIQGDFLIELDAKLNVGFWEDYLNEQSDFQLLCMLARDSHFEQETFSKMKRLSNCFEFILRSASYVVANWCIDVYVRLYGVNRSVFYICDSSDEHQNIVAQLNEYKNSLMESQADVSHIIQYQFSLQTGEITGIQGKLFDIYQNCSSLLK
ncbi:MAG: hypothetical protein V3G42_08795 [Oscillospiraceae bacterium]